MQQSYIRHSAAALLEQEIQHGRGDHVSAMQPLPGDKHRPQTSSIDTMAPILYTWERLRVPACVLLSNHAARGTCIPSSQDGISTLRWLLSLLMGSCRS